MKRMHVTLDEDALEDARRLTGKKSYSDTINHLITEAVRQDRLKAIDDQSDDPELAKETLRRLGSRGGHARARNMSARSLKQSATNASAAAQAKKKRCKHPAERRFVRRAGQRIPITQHPASKDEAVYCSFCSRAVG